MSLESPRNPLKITCWTPCGINPCCILCALFASPKWLLFKLGILGQHSSKFPPAALATSHQKIWCFGWGMALWQCFGRGLIAHLRFGCSAHWRCSAKASPCHGMLWTLPCAFRACGGVQQQEKKPKNNYLKDFDSLWCRLWTQQFFLAVKMSSKKAFRSSGLVGDLFASHVMFLWFLDTPQDVLPISGQVDRARFANNTKRQRKPHSWRFTVWTWETRAMLEEPVATSGDESED